MNKKSYQVNWNIYGVTEVVANNEEEAREVIENMSKEELNKIILEEARNGFDFGTIEEVEIIKPIDESTIDYKGRVLVIHEDCREQFDEDNNN